MRSRTDRLWDWWDELGLWNQYGLTVVATLALIWLALEIAAA